MKRFELWLDESGEFLDGEKNPENNVAQSMVAGLLIAERSFNDREVEEIIPELQYHSVTERDQISRFILIDKVMARNKANRFIVFSNDREMTIVDGSITYLNIISEGILQLIKTLKSQYGEIFLSVLIANRKNVELVDGVMGTLKENIELAREDEKRIQVELSKQTVFSTDEYEARLREKLIIGGHEHAVSDGEWELKKASARWNKKLMLCDIVCNTFYTRDKIYGDGRHKFNENERTYINKVYEDNTKTWVFPALESVVEKSFRNSLIENKIGEAVALVCQTKNEELIERCFYLLRQHISTKGLSNINVEYKFIEAYIENYINVTRSFDNCEIFLNNILRWFIPLLKEYEKDPEKTVSEKLTIDIRFYLLTVLTHKGDIYKSDTIIEELKEEIKKLPSSIDTMDYRIKFEGRVASHLINEFDYETALTNADELVEKCREVKDVLSLVNDDQPYYDELAKALGTRLQAKSYLLRYNPEMYQTAVADSEEAIKEFRNDRDKRRQYSYRVHLETEKHNYDEALWFLKKSIAVDKNDSIKTLWKAAEKDVFAVSAYIRLMSEAADCWSIKYEMEKPLASSNYIQNNMAHDRLYHPYELIFWKYASYCAKGKSKKASISYFDKAVDICFKEEDFTLFVIGMAIEFEERAVILKYKLGDQSKHIKRLRRNWDRVIDNDSKCIAIGLFGDVDFENNNPDYYMSLSRKITL